METKLVGGLPQRMTTKELNSPKVDDPQFVDQVTGDEMIVMLFIGRNPYCSRHEIAFELNISPTRCEVAIRELEKKGLIERKEDWNCVQ